MLRFQHDICSREYAVVRFDEKWAELLTVQATGPALHAIAQRPKHSLHAPTCMVSEVTGWRNTAEPVGDWVRHLCCPPRRKGPFNATETGGDDWVTVNVPSEYRIGVHYQTLKAG
jgi:hypothetical protein